MQKKLTPEQKAIEAKKSYMKKWRASIYLHYFTNSIK
jgi:hypothetical protein